MKEVNNTSNKINYYYKEKQLEDLPGEVWKVIEHAPLYRVSNLGRVKATTYEKWHNNGRRLNFYLTHINAQCFNKQGYLVTTLIDKNGKKHTFRVNRLVAEAFISNPLKLPHVNHLNEMREDNRIQNLKWCTEKENSNYGLRNARISKAKGFAVECDGCEFTSINKAARFYGYSPSVFWLWLKDKEKMPDEWKRRGLQIKKD